MAHTPGPWMACGDGTCRCKTVNSEEHPVAHVVSGEWGDEHEGRMLVYGSVDEEFAEANARLIAAAPELLEACKAVYEHVGKGGDLDWHLREYGLAEQLAAAITKAKGENE